MSTNTAFVLSASCKMLSKNCLHFEEYYWMLKIPVCTLALLQLLYLGQQLNTHTAACSLPTPHQWGRGENKSKSKTTHGLR